MSVLIEFSSCALTSFIVLIYFVCLVKSCIKLIFKIEIYMGNCIIQKYSIRINYFFIGICAQQRPNTKNWLFYAQRHKTTWQPPTLCIRYQLLHICTSFYHTLMLFCLMHEKMARSEQYIRIVCVLRLNFRTLMHRTRMIMFFFLCRLWICVQDPALPSLQFEFNAKFNNEDWYTIRKYEILHHSR